jgi:DNA-binding SARP family transcriptional activator
VPTRRLDISVLGPLAIAIDGIPVTGSALRRSRVRTLLALLTVHGAVTRDLAIDLLWPEHDAAGGARNLRVTLTYLRQLLEPDRPAGEASFHVRADANTITLHPSDHVAVDLWELRRRTDQAISGDQRADTDATIALLDAATSMWRGEPLTDLASVGGQDHEVERVRLLQLEGLLRLSELRLVRGAAAQALIDAERALALDPYSERAHRLAIAAALRMHDRPRTAAVSQRTLAMLDELGVEPEPATQILLRHVRAAPAH